MDVDIRHDPSFAVARCTLAAGEAVKAESGAMMATSDGVGVEAEMQGGLMSGLKRSVLGGESLFVTTFTAPDEGGWVDCATKLPGDIAAPEIEFVPPGGQAPLRGSESLRNPRRRRARAPDGRRLGRLHGRRRRLAAWCGGGSGNDRGR